MTEDTKVADTGIEISNEEMTKFLTSRKDGYACPICASTNWLGMTDGTGRTAGIPWLSAQGGLEPNAVKVLAMFCAQCGFLRAHEVSIFRKYLNAEHEDE